AELLKVFQGRMAASRGMCDDDELELWDRIDKALAALQAEPVALAKRFHEAYERLAPAFGYKTREDTREFDPNSSNGRLMIAVCSELAGCTPQPAKEAEPVA